MIMKRILFLTSTNLAANPRLVKELRLAVQQGFNATVIEFRLGNWSDEKTDLLKQEFASVAFIELSALRSPFVPWLASSLLQKICSALPVGIMTTWMLSVSAGKRSWLLLQGVQKIKNGYDWVIAHNPAAFYPAMRFAQRTNTALGIDVEDYHPGETNEAKASEKMKELMRKTLPSAAYCSFASPLIMNYVEQDIASINHKQYKIVNNVFSVQDFSTPVFEQSIRKKIKLVWFSQFVDYGRGLEQLFPILDKFRESIELTLIGSMNPLFSEKELAHRNYITCLSSMAQSALHQQLRHYDIGLAVEDSRANFNRNICLTNKIWAFFQAGLYILATPTDAQRYFLEQHSLHGELLLPGDADNTVRKLVDHKEKLFAGKEKRYGEARHYNWEKESMILLREWNMPKRRTTDAV